MVCDRSKEWLCHCHLDLEAAIRRPHPGVLIQGAEDEEHRLTECPLQFTAINRDACGEVEILRETVSGEIGLTEASPTCEDDQIPEDGNRIDPDKQVAHRVIRRAE